MAKGCLVISTNVGSIPSVIIHDFNGLLIKPHDLSSIIQTIELLIRLEYDISKIRRNAISTAKNFSFEKQIILFENILNEKFV